MAALPSRMTGNTKTNSSLLYESKTKEKHGNHRDYYIFGHTHLATEVPITDNSRVILLGDCFEQWTYAQLDDKGNLEIKNYNV